MNSTCLACGDVNGTPLVDLGDVPVLCGVTWQDRAGARSSPRGRMALMVCARCGHVWNGAFDQRLMEYDERYDNTLHFSPTFQAYAEELAQRLDAAYQLRGKHVIEIGSGKGEFLELLCDYSGATATGYDRSYEGGAGHPAVEFVRDYFPLGEPAGQPIDLLVSRHVLEHIEAPFEFLRGLAASARKSGGEGIFYLEVPNAAFDFGPTGKWDCIYPHVSYFGEASLRHIVRRAGFEILRFGEAFFGEFLFVEARPLPAEPVREPVAANRELVDRHLETVRSFADQYRAAVRRWAERIAECEREGSPVALWGAGARGVAFLNAADPDARIPTVVDINPNKWGRHLPVTGHQVVAPEHLTTRPPGLVLVTNPVYTQEISGQLETLGIDAEVVAV